MQNEQTPLSAEDTLHCPDVVKATDVSNYDEVEELILLHMADDIDPVSPKLKAIMAQEGSTHVSLTGNRRQMSPLLMERPKSSGIDTSAFCFGKPTQGPNSFSLQPAKRSPLGTTSCEADSPPNHGNKLSSNHKGQSQELSSYPENAGSGTGTLKVALQDRQPETQKPQATAPSLPHKALEAEHILHVSHMPIETQVAGRTGTTKESAKRLTTTRPNESSMMSKRCNEQSKMLDQHILAPTNHKAKIAKRNGIHKERAIVGSTNGGSPLSEEDLFHLLIDRIRDREESAIAALHIRQQMETEIIKVAEENDALKIQLELSNKQIQKQASDLKICESRLGTWKLKLMRFKGFLNELGCDFQNLRGDAIQLKATRKELLNERDEITAGISEAKAKLAEASSSVDQRREQLLKVEGQHELIRQDLRNAETRANYLLHQLSDEKKRSKLLELYIQDCSRAQTTKLGQIMSHQHEMMKNMDTALESLGHQHDALLKTIQGSLCSDLNECLMSLREVSEKSSSGQKGVHECKEIMQNFALRIDSMMLQLNSDISREAKSNESLTQSLKEQILVIEEHIASDCNLSKQLSINSDNYESLRKTLEAFKATTEKITCSMQGLESKEIGLAGQMNAFGISLAEARIPQQIEPSREEICGYEMKIQGMKDKMESLSEDLNAAQAALKAKELETEAMKISMSEASSKADDSESRARACESEAAALRDEVKSVEIRVREELNRASVVSREQDRAKYEQQLHELLREKADVERNIDRLSTQLAGARLALAEYENKMKERESEMQLILTSKEMKIDNLKSHALESAAKLEDQEKEVARLTEVESVSVTQQASLHNQLEEATSRIRILVDERSRAINESHKSSQDLEAKFDALEMGFRKKEKEFALIQENLTAAISEKSDLECSQQKAKEEMHTLLERVEDSENKMNKIEEILSQMGLSTPGQSFTEVCGILQTSLLTAQNKPIDPQSNASPSGRDVSCSNAVTATPQKDILGLGQELYKAEVIYRTQSIQASIISSPFPREVKLGENSIASQERLCSVENPNIVPFSSIRQQASPRDSPVFGHDENDLAAMLMLTPGKKVITECDAPSKSDETLATKPTELKQEKLPRILAPEMAINKAALEVKDSVPLSNSQPDVKGTEVSENRGSRANTKPKAVTFETESPKSAGQKRKQPESKSNDAPSKVQNMSLIEDQPARVNRRTYSRVRHSVSRGAAKATEVARFSAGDAADGDTHVPITRAAGNKRAKASIDPPGQRQTKSVSEYFERKSSPTKLASGSSRPPSMNANQSNNQKWPARGRSSRRTRGEHYNARFNRGA
ncbi:hypothetical protein BO94DRAFT_599173 [Aspergillus sclerotioniger CBS 115572]|uniref:Rootletin n=1 Tax=Aspergillus sclerotioniger CBS 115572 TaxID=1450535 RepID=A0A317WHY3_9EURO|nr:hypothetical protein BO94DRAFT_599173 [Aspergillus sclerotioniger CBS 115572]PWY83810.1 hypothetical protein BO94DRAFT_599173 [Aspergillus sclerotioniger CBS 115572]